MLNLTFRTYLIFGISLFAAIARETSAFFAAVARQSPNIPKKIPTIRPTIKLKLTY